MQKQVVSKSELEQRLGELCVLSIQKMMLTHLQYGMTAQESHALLLESGHSLQEIIAASRLLVQEMKERGLM